MHNKNSRDAISVLNGTITEKVVPNAFLELDKCSQVSLAIKSTLKRKLSMTVQPLDNVS